MMSKVWIMGAALAGALAIAGPALADMEVARSTAPAYTKGQKLADGAQLDVPEGTSVTVRDASGVTHTIDGPFKGTIANYTKAGCPAWKRVLGQCPKGDDDEHTVTRGMARKPVEK